MAQIVRRPTVDIPQALKDYASTMQRIFSTRGIDDPQVLEFALTDLLPPDKMKGLPEALARLHEALIQKQRILVVGDFDADGATSTAVTVKLLREMGADSVSFLVPNRFTCGYGLTPLLVEQALPFKADLIITVDNGISSIAGVESANAHGMDVIVTDHHLAGEELPKAVAIINPNQPGCSFESKAMAGVGVAYYLQIALRRYLIEKNWFETQGLPVPNMASVLDIVALGTVADVVPLDRNNQILVERGLRRLRRSVCCPGIQALYKVAGKSLAETVASDLGFAIGPRLNAAGRLEDMSIGIACLLSETDEEAMTYATTLNDLNVTRREIEADMSAQAFKAVDKLSSQGVVPMGLCVYDKDWHQGVVGLVASRIKEHFSRPVIAFAPDGEGKMKGSARSVPGFHIRDALVEVSVKYPDLIGSFGGHAMAAGLSIKSSAYKDFSAAFDEVVARARTEEDCKQLIVSDGELPSVDMTLSFADYLRYVIPWGQGMPEPVFDGEFRLLSQRVVGSSHLKIQLQMPGDAHPVDAIWFRADTEKWAHVAEQTVRVAYRLDVNTYRSTRRLQLIVLTMMEA